jgi:predicted thioesterase
VDNDALNILRSVPAGLFAEIDMVVGAEHLAGVRGVLSTPAMISLMERAASRALTPLLPEGWTSVGTEVCVRHLAATLPGETVRASATLLEAAGRRLRFRVEAHNATRMIGEGTHERAVVHLNRFRDAARRSR